MLIACAAVACSGDKGGERPRLTGSAQRAGSSAAADAGPKEDGTPGRGGKGGSPTGLIDVAAAGRGGSAARGVASISAGTGARGSQVEACAQTAQDAERVPVDMYIMLDRSDSMTEVTGAGPTKWDAIRSALRLFLADARSAGLGVGLQFFPLRTPGVPETCQTHQECGPGGPCLNGICVPTMSGAFIPIACSDASHCPADSGGCTTEVGRCSRATNTLCFNVGFAGCGLQGSCEQVNVVGLCGGLDSCDAKAYATPAVKIAALPQNATALIATLDAEMTLGRTPTAAALSGALQHAKSHAQSEPTHRVVAVLATDGLPTECEPTDAAGVGELAQAARAGTPSIPTYVVGVFGQNDAEARDNLTRWAVAGGTQGAFIVDPSQDVAAQFLDALDKIRSGSIACEYRIPPSPTGSALDLDRVNVALIEGSKTSEFLYVTAADRCDRAELGWHYDVDPSSGTPTKIVVCPKACDALRSTDNGRVEVRLGCKTVSPD